MLKFDMYHGDFINIMDRFQDAAKICSKPATGLAWSYRENKLNFSCDDGTLNTWTVDDGCKEASKAGNIKSLCVDMCRRVVAVNADKKYLVRYHKGTETYYGNRCQDVEISPECLAYHSSGIVYFGDSTGIYYVLPENLAVFKASKNMNVNPVCICCNEKDNMVIFSDSLTGNVFMSEIEHDATFGGRTMTIDWASDFKCGPAVSVAVSENNIFIASADGILILDKAGLKIARLYTQGVPRAICTGEGKLFVATDIGIFAYDLIC